MLIALFLSPGDVEFPDILSNSMVNQTVMRPWMRPLSVKFQRTIILFSFYCIHLRAPPQTILGLCVTSFYSRWSFSQSHSIKCTHPLQTMTMLKTKCTAEKTTTMNIKKQSKCDAILRDLLLSIPRKYIFVLFQVITFLTTY